MQAYGDAKRALKTEAYLRGAVRCRGLCSGDLEKRVRELSTKPEVARLLQGGPAAAWSLCGELLRSSFLEDKETGIRLLGASLKGRCGRCSGKKVSALAARLRGFAGAFDAGVNTWAVCDSFCSRVVKVWLEQTQQVWLLVPGRLAHRG